MGLYLGRYWALCNLFFSSVAFAQAPASVTVSYRMLGTYGEFFQREKKCDQFVRLNKAGQFLLGNSPYELSGTNFRIQLAVQVLESSDSPSYELFLAPEWNYEPDNSSFCASPASWDSSRVCCDSAETCLPKLVNDHILPLASLEKPTVRLLMDYVQVEPESVTNPAPYLFLKVQQVQSATSEEIPPQVRIRLDALENRNAFFLAVRDAIRLLGSYGIRSILLLNGRARFQSFPDEQQIYLDFLTELGSFLGSEPSLIGYDLFNEPAYHDESGAVQSKSVARSLAMSWKKALRVHDQKHLITLGNTPPEWAMSTWDPLVLPLDFQSPHIYSATNSSNPLQRLSNWESLLKQSIFLMQVASCGPGGQTCEDGRQPIVLGETGFAVSGVRENGSPDVYESSSNPSVVFPKGYGNNSEQNSFLNTVFDMTRACHFQGLWWWEFADVHWGYPLDLMGLFTHYRNVGLANAPAYRDQLFVRPAFHTLRNTVSYLNPPNENSMDCSLGGPVLPPEWMGPNTFRGKVQTLIPNASSPGAGTLQPIQYAQVRTMGYPSIVVYTNEDGEFEFESNLNNPPSIQVSAYRYVTVTNSSPWSSSPSTAQPSSSQSAMIFEHSPITLTRVPAHEISQYSPPRFSAEELSCLEVPVPKVPRVPFTKRVIEIIRNK